MPSPNVDVDRSAIEQVSAELLAGLNAADASRCAVLWAPDGMLMPPKHATVKGPRAIEEYFRSRFARSRFRFEFSSSGIHLDGNLAVDHLTYTTIVWLSKDGPTVQKVGKELRVFTRRPDGSWRISFDIWNGDE